ncbi:carbonic anhydrase 2 [Musca domestica]|uniref:Carbonic anhydrase n=1 Tax=Musca domestica TaxID=7370 RepID=A0ABM3UM88_MUSDO|nr:carbonic anhydrase 2 [Musca domestica]
MLPYMFLITAFLSLSGLPLSNADTSAHWGYPDYSENEEFPKWGGTCDTGTRQSPINLSLRSAIKGVYEKLEGDNHDKSITELSMVNTGHSVQLSDFDVDIELEGGPLKDEYVLEQIHFHWWSEHTIENVRYPFEMHMVHRNKKYPNMTVATLNKDGLVVVGVLYHASLERNRVVDDILSDFVPIMSYEQINNPIKIKTNFKISDLVPAIPSYITYEGSLTTPGCNEAVTWIVLAETFPIGIDQVEAFKSLECERGKTLANNYRVIQKTNDRAVIIVTNEFRKDSGNGSASLESTGSLYAMLVIAGILLKYFN